MLLGTDSLVGCEERSFDSLHSLRMRIQIGCEERSFVAVLLRRDSLIGCEEGSFDSLHSLRIRILIGCVVNNKTPPYVFHKCSF
jgi:ribosomal protein L30/L7E